MDSRTAARAPALPETHYLDNRIYTDESIFRKEQERIFSRVWQFVCHESEVPRPGDFRRTTVGHWPLVIVRDLAGAVRAFHNVCRHRAAEVVREECGNTRHFRCFYHQWTYRLDGALEAVAKPEGYARVGLDRSALGLVEVRVEQLAGLVFVCLDPEAASLRSFLGEMGDRLADVLSPVSLEVFHFHKAVLNTNWKLWMDNNNDGYHALMHVVNRDTSPWLLSKGQSMKAHIFPNGHRGHWSVGAPSVVAYEKRGISVGGGTLPGLQDRELRQFDIFPDLLVMVRSNVVRIDRMVPIEPGRTLVEWRGLGVIGDSEELREARVQHHNVLWGPTGRNLPEDQLAVESQWRAMQSDVVRYSILAREEDLDVMDDAGMRNYYAEWGRCMGCSPAAPFAVEP